MYVEDFEDSYIHNFCEIKTGTYLIYVQFNLNLFLLTEQKYIKFCLNIK